MSEISISFGLLIELVGVLVFYRMGKLRSRRHSCP
jgi:hypothetical protein